MRHPVPLATLQLWHQKPRLVAAIAGVSFAVVLIFMQLGFREALFDSAVRYHRTLGYGLAVIAPRTDNLTRSLPFSRNRLFQTLSDPDVAAVTPVYLEHTSLVNPDDRSKTRQIMVLGFDPERGGIDLPGLESQKKQLRLRDRALIDRFSRPEFAAVIEGVKRNGRVETEAANRRIEITGFVEMGSSFGIDGSLITSDLNFTRLFPHRKLNQIDLGLIKLEAGADPVAVQSRLRERLQRDVIVLTREEFIGREVAYWNGATPIGYVFSFGAIMGIIVGAIIVYQILFSDVQDHLKEYATLKAMGYPQRYLMGVVLREAALLASLGFLPGMAATFWLYEHAGAATRLPIEMTAPRAATVLILAVTMCAVSGMLALRKLRSADPASVF